MSILLAAAIAAAPIPGEVKTFRDWTVACDNVRSCTAVALMPDEGADDHLSLILKRTGDAAPLIEVEAYGEPLPLKGQTVELLVDGVVAQSLGEAGGGAILAALTPATLAKMANGGRVSMRAGGKIAGNASLAGFSAALRYWDAAQRREGSTTALVAKGSATRVPVPPAPPRIVVPQFRRGTAAPLDAATIAALTKRFQCDEARFADAKPEVHRLSASQVLILLPCGAGAYNFSSRAIIATGSGRSARYVAAEFDFLPRGSADPTGASLVNASFDPGPGTLGTYAKARGVGDCGSSEDYAWDGARFRLIDQTVMQECRGSLDWMRTWTAKAVSR